MPRYEIVFLLGAKSYEVEADTEDDAIEAAAEKLSLDCANDKPDCEIREID